MKTVLITLLCSLARLAAAENYVIIYEDGAAQTGNQTSNTYSWSGNTNAPSIGGEPLLRDPKTIRYVRELHRGISNFGGYIQMANGDVLPGLPAAILPADQEFSLPRRLLALMTAPCRSYRSNSSEMVVRLERVAAIVPSKEAEKVLNPGTVLLRDGTPIEYKSARWGDDGLKLLTKTGIKRVPFADLAGYRAKNIDYWKAMQEDASMPSPDPNDRLIQFRLTNGAILTGKRMLLVELGTELMGIQPSWAFTGIRFSTKNDVVGRSLRNINETYLSMMPSTTLAQKSYTGFLWPWQKDRDVRGQELQTGQLRASNGFGTHAYSEIKVALPPGANTLDTWVGLTESVGSGGCVECSIYGDEIKGHPIWQSTHLRGDDAPKRITSLDVSQHQHLILVTDYGHEKRPPGADPLDIRDEVNWLQPIITGDVSTMESVFQHYARITNALPQWEGGQDLLKRGKFTAPSAMTWWSHWGHALYLDVAEEVRLKHTVQVGPTNSWLQILATRGRPGKGGHVISVHVNGKLHEPRGWMAEVEKQWIRQWENLHTDKRGSGHLNPMDWDLGRFTGQEVDVEIVITPHKALPEQPLPMLALEDIRFRPVFRAQNENNHLPIDPEIPLDSLKPVHQHLPLEGIQLQPGKLANGKPITLFHYPFESGLGVPGGTVLTFKLNPSWKRFVSLIGYSTESRKDIGPFKISFDGEVAYTSRRFGWWSTADQIDINIPEGAAQMTLSIRESDSWGAWAKSGFMTVALPALENEESPQ